MARRRSNRVEAIVFKSGNSYVTVDAETFAKALAEQHQDQDQDDQEMKRHVRW